MTDEKAPKEADFAALLARLWRPPPGAALVFNCQMGRGRTTTGLVIATLVALRRAQGQGGPTLPRSPAPELPPWFCARVSPPPSPRPASDADLRAGRFAAVRSLLRALDGGADAKAALDAVLDAAGGMQNLREAIAGYRARLAAEPDDDKRSSLLRRGGEGWIGRDNEWGRKGRVWVRGGRVWARPG